MNGKDFELRRELWMWRGVGILLFVINMLLTLFGDIQDRARHAEDNKERAAHWQKAEDGIEGNRRMILTLDDHLRACLACHAHDPLVTGPVNVPKTEIKKK